MLKVNEAVRAAHGTAADAATAIQTVPGFEHVDHRNISRWKLCMKDMEDRKSRGLRGRTVDRICEASVMSKLVVMVADSPVADRARQAVVGVDEILFDPIQMTTARRNCQNAAWSRKISHSFCTSGACWALGAEGISR